MPKVITIGAAVKDVFLTPSDVPLVKNKKLFTGGSGLCLEVGGKYEASEIFYDTGGGATNAAATLRSLGISCGVQTKIGNDISGYEIISDLMKRKVSTQNVHIDKNFGTGFSIILQFPSGDRSIVVYRGASSKFETKDLVASRLVSEWFYLTSVKGNSAFVKKVFSIAKKNRTKVFWNPGLREIKMGVKKLKPFLTQTNVLSVNREESYMLSGKSTLDEAAVVLGSYAKLVVITDGKKGAYVFSLDQLYYIPSTGSKPLNTTGAGDAFGSGFLAGLIKYDDWQPAVKVGVWNADGVVQKMGAKHGLITKLPSKAQMLKIKIKKV